MPEERFVETEAEQKYSGSCCVTKNESSNLESAYFPDANAAQKVVYGDLM
jgi:hypothetical protein